ncbi:MAG TPA: bacterioferritin [Rhizobiales bacterium]|nr:bacterioferritin [bacterium BMS3Bbin10]HDO51311.1 bacterioferritin [Hyphomicrobiales bacterium]
MSANAEVIKDLQTALSMELTAVNQYLLHALVCEDWGLGKLGAKMRAEMSEELGHAESFAQRIIFLKGDPELTPAKAPHRAQALEDMFEADLRDEEEAIVFYTKAARTADEAGDIGTRDIFERNAMDEEGHKAWLEQQLALLKRMGEPTFLALQIGDPAGQE